MSATTSISIPGYPDSNRVPGDYFVVQPQGGPSQQNQRALIIAPMLAAGTAAPNVPQISAGVADAQTKYGTASIAAQMVADYIDQDSFGELWVLPIAQPTGSAGTGTLALAGTATAAGTLSLYIAAQRVPVAVNSGDTATVIATNVAAAVNALVGFPVTATAATGTLTFTAVDKTIAGADIDIRLNYLGTAAGEATPPGITPTITAFTGGVTNPSLTTALANLGTKTFDWIISAFNDATSIAAISQLLQDQSGRWSWEEELFGHAFYAFRGNLSALVTEGGLYNDQHAAILGVYDTPWPMYRVVTDLTAACAVSLRSDPALPLQTLALNMPAPPVQSRFNISEMNSLLYDGISTFVVNDANQVSIGRLITTYRLNPAGVPDDSYLDVETMFTLMFLLRDMRSFLQTIYARKKLVADGSLIAAGSNAVTSQLILQSAIARYQTYCTQGLAQNYATFAAKALAQNAGGGLVKLSLPFDLANQLRIIASLALFTKS
jgi:phage tail sheath gpL-like